MALRIFYEKDANPAKLKGKKIAVVGYGSQGHAHANNLKDSGYEVVVGLKKGGESWGKAERAGLKVLAVPEAARVADVLMIVAPDEQHPQIYHDEIEPNARPGLYLGFAHGFNIHYGQIRPPKTTNVFMIAPKGPGHLLRHEFTKGAGIPSLLAVHQDPAGDTKEVALAYGCGLGSGKAGIIETTFREETETDLFGEQTVLCGGVSALVQAAYETLVEAGYAPEMAYFECLHELKLIVDLMYEGGIANMRYSVSNTAKYGDVTRGPRVIDAHVKAEMKKILDEIQTGQFAREWILENKANRPVFNALLERGAEHGIEKVGEQLRGMMSWLAKNRLVDKSRN